MMADVNFLVFFFKCSSIGLIKTILPLKLGNTILYVQNMPNFTLPQNN